MRSHDTPRERGSTAPFKSTTDARQFVYTALLPKLKHFDFAQHKHFESLSTSKKKAELIARVFLYFPETIKAGNISLNIWFISIFFQIFSQS